MDLLASLQASAVVAVSVVVGVAAHEAVHVAVLRLAGVSHSVEVLPDDGAGRVESVWEGALVRVTPDGDGADISPWQLRSAALMPLCLSAPLALVLAGVVPDPFSGGHLTAQVALVAWLGCSIPSPQDFSLAWYPERALAAARDGA